MKRFYLSRTDNRIRTRLYWRKTIDGSVIGIFNEVIRQCYVFLDRDGDRLEKCMCVARTVSFAERTTAAGEDDDAWANITFAFMVSSHGNNNGRTDGRFVRDATQSGDVSRCSEQTRINIVNEMCSQDRMETRVCATFSLKQFFPLSTYQLRSEREKRERDGERINAVRNKRHETSLY